ncbi:tetratricopeptide repeat protein [Fischerella sp. PCC 9605]|uniref:tetratricopeptide repeat protein n=1 Tax=Fischerella sp. PCC 9605 TaxID=1173024 RepID=UPI0004BCEEE2|nr:tetratricopeptide repeat protein [Fischerella sp. PCC 9605]
MKIYHALIAISVGVSIVLIQPQLAIAHNSNQVTGIALKVAAPSSSQYLDPELIIEQEGKTYPILTTVYRVEAPGKPYKENSIATVTKAEDFFTLGDEKFKQGDYKGATAAYTEAIRLNPNNGYAYTQRGIARASLKDYQGAIEDYTQALRIAPNHSIAYGGRGDARTSLGDQKGAIEDYTKALQINPNSEIDYRGRGNARYLLKDYQGAIEDYTQALRINPSDAISYSGRGDARASLGDYQGAIEDYTQALRIDPNYANTYFNRGNARYLLKDYQGAIEDYTQALRIDPNDAEAKKNRDRLKAKNVLNMYSAEQRFQITLFVSVLLCLVWIISISLHEFGHAIVAYWGGDKSVKQKGYLSLNPLKYINPFVSIILPGLFFLMGGFPLPGAAVYIERQHLRNRWWQSAVSAAGPLASFLVTLLLIVFFQVSLSWNFPYWLSAALAFFISLHFFFVLFNLMPFPPLDGYGIIEAWIPSQNIQAQLRNFALVGLIAIYILPWLIPPFGLFIAKPAFALTQMFGVPETLFLAGFELFNRWYCALLLGAVGVFALIRQPQSVWHFLGDVLFSLKMYKMALFAYNKAIDWAANARSWTHNQVWVKRDIVLEQLGRWEEALINYNKAIELKPDDAWFWNQRGWLLEKLERDEEALINYNKLIELKPDDVWYWKKCGQLLEKLERDEEALINYNKAIELMPDNAWVWNQRGWLLEKLKRDEEALINYNKAIELKPDDAWFWSQRGLLLKKLKRDEEALINYNKAIELKPDDAWFWSQRGLLLKKLKRDEEALINYNKAIELKPDDACFLVIRGIVLEQLERCDDALASYNKAIQLQQNYDFAWYHRSRMYALQGKVELAIENLQCAIELKPYQWRESAKTDSNFDKIRQHERFQQLIGNSDLV